MDIHFHNLIFTQYVLVLSDLIDLKIKNCTKPNLGILMLRVVKWFFFLLKKIIILRHDSLKEIYKQLHEISIKLGVSKICYVVI
jgi:hypothetical protein